MGLQKYRHKRNFKVSTEPSGKKISRGSKKKFIYVIQKHAASHLHYDLRLEVNGVLKSWAVPKGPSLDPKIKHLAVAVEDHPIQYAAFEGTIPKGEYGGGTVMVWDKGYWQPLDDNVMAAYRKGDLNFVLHGKKLQGRWKLIRLKPKAENQAKTQWLWFKIKDDYSCDTQTCGEITQSKPKSAATNRTMTQIEKGASKDDGKKSLPSLRTVKGVYRVKMPDFIHPQLATLVSKAPQGAEWLHEIKWDGYRLLARIFRNKITLLTRRNHDWTLYFSSIVNALKSLHLNNAILDGEIVALDDQNKINFQVLQNSLENSGPSARLIYYIFDLLYFNGYSLLNVPLIERKKILQTVLMSKSSQNSSIQFSNHIVNNGLEVFKKACHSKFEGIISKEIHGAYISKRTRQWLKIKCARRQEFVIGGFTDPKSSRQYFGALLLGFYDKNKRLLYCGKVGTGFTEASLFQLAKIFKKYPKKDNPFDYLPKIVTKNVHWLKPKLVAEIEFLEMTQEGILRHPSFKGLRLDKKANIISLELPEKKHEG